MIVATVLTHNRIKTAIKSIQSLVIDPFLSKIIVIDDASSPENLAVLKKFCSNIPKIDFISNRENLGYNRNLIQALSYLRRESADLLFLCESDMLLCKGWGEIIEKSFKLSQDTVCITPMLHIDHFMPNKSEKFKKLYLEGFYLDGKKMVSIGAEKPFGSCYAELPDEQVPIRIGKIKLIYVPNSVGTMVFRNKFLKKLPLDQIRNYPGHEDAWLCWSCFEYNNYHPKSLGALVPGLALTFGQTGLHGCMFLLNERWLGSFWWRFKTTSIFVKFFYRLRLIFLGVMKKYLIVIKNIF